MKITENAHVIRIQVKTPSRLRKYLETNVMVLNMSATYGIKGKKIVLNDKFVCNVLKADKLLLK